MDQLEVKTEQYQLYVGQFVQAELENGFVFGTIVGYTECDDKGNPEIMVVRRMMGGLCWLVHWSKIEPAKNFHR